MRRNPWLRCGPGEPGTGRAPRRTSVIMAPPWVLDAGQDFDDGLSLRLLPRHAAVELKDAGALVDRGSGGREGPPYVAAVVRAGLAQAARRLASVGGRLRRAARDPQRRPRLGE